MYPSVNLQNENIAVVLIIIIIIITCDVDSVVDVSNLYAASIFRVDSGDGNGIYFVNVGKTVSISMV
jgi:hypothetical protein